MSDKLTDSDLSEVLSALKKVTNPHELGIHLKVDVAKVEEIEKNHPRDISRQKTEVVKHWLRNSPDASWATLTNAVERMGGHARLAERLNSKEMKSEEEKQNTSAIKVERMRGHARVSNDKEENQRTVSYYVRTKKQMYSVQSSLDKCLKHNILLLGKMGHGKSTLGNRILNSDGWFKINDQRCPQTTHGSSMLISASQLKDYKIKAYDHSGIFEGASSTEDLSSAVPNKLNLVIFVLKCGCDFDDSEVTILKSIMYKWQISRISALVLTHCERLSEEERGEMIEQFKKDHPSITELMGKGILAVGFPDNSHIQPGSLLSQRVVEDKANLRQLIYSCDEPAFIPRYENWKQPENEQPLKNENEQPEPLQVENGQPPQNVNRRCLCCSIL